MASPLPGSWTPESDVRFTAPIFDQIFHNDTKTIIRKGIWRIEIRGYAVIIPGDEVSFVGRAEPKLLGRKVVEIIMKDPTFEVIKPVDRRRLSLWERGVLINISIRDRVVNFLEKALPEPMSSLAAGILLGVSRQMPSDFYQSLVETGTLHLVAASGYNVSIVAAVLMAIFSLVTTRGVATLGAIVGILFYVVIAGASASVWRAGIMGSLTLMAYYFGRPAEARRLLWIAVFMMLMANPLNLIEVGFQLTVAATVGILYIEPWLRRWFNIKLVWLLELLKNYFYPTLAATFATTPIILFQFGRLSLISPLVNVLVLPVIPLIMGLTATTSLVGMVWGGAGQVIAWFLYPPLWYVTQVIKLFGGIAR